MRRVPLSTRFTTARVVSNRNSSIGRGRPSDVCSQQTGDVGWIEDAGAAPVELGEHRVPDRVAEVGPADVGEQDEPVDVELVDAVRDLGDRGVDVGQRQRAQQTEATGVVDDGSPAGLVHLAGQVGRGRVVGEVDARRRDRQERGGDPQAVHQRHVLLGRPRRDLRHAVGLGVAGLLERLPVGLGQVVGVDVELADDGHDSTVLARLITIPRDGHAPRRDKRILERRRCSKPILIN